MISNTAAVLVLSMPSVIYSGMKMASQHHGLHLSKVSSASLPSLVICRQALLHQDVQSVCDLKFLQHLAQACSAVAMIQDVTSACRCPCLCQHRCLPRPRPLQRLSLW